MLNFEKYKEEVLEIINDDEGLIEGLVAVDKATNEPVDCYGFSCKDCSFCNNCCTNTFIKWLYSEYKNPQQPIKITQLEYEILKYLKIKGFNYLAKDETMDLYAFTYKPTKEGECLTRGGRNEPLFLFNSRFQFIKWEDEEPTLINDILNNCEVIEDEQ